MIKSQYKFIILIGVICVSLSVFYCVFAQENYFKEYLLPITGHEPTGTAISQNGNELDTTGVTISNSCVSDQGVITTNCVTLNYPDKNTVFGSGEKTYNYKFSVPEEGYYALNLTVSNFNDDFSKLTEDQINYLNSQTNSTLSASDYRNYTLEVTVDNNDYINIIQVPAQSQKNPATGFTYVGNLSAGSHLLHIKFSDPFSFSYAGIDLPAYLGGFTNVKVLGTRQDVNKNLIIYQVALQKTKRVADVIGIRIYPNMKNLDPLSWYYQNLKVPGQPTPVKVDGYEGVKDDRTIYVSASNITEAGVFYTNVYVIQLGENAAPDSVNIFNQFVANFKFNQNISGGEVVKDQLRRDTKRLADLQIMYRLLENYKSRTGKYPTLDAGTFVKGHALSIWPSWTAALGNALGSSLPTDPVNKISPGVDQGLPRQYDATLGTESGQVKVVCSRDKDGKALTGCPDGTQCNADYCSICPAGYDPKTCWNETTGRFYFDLAEDGSFNLQNSFVYQYTSVDNGASYRLGYRLEYNKSNCKADQCYYEGKCYQPSECLAGCTPMTLGKAIQLNGNNYIEVPNSASLHSNEISISLWFKPFVLDKKWVTLLVKGNLPYCITETNCSNREYSIGLSQDGYATVGATPVSTAGVSILGLATNNRPDNTITANKWYHIVGVISTAGNYIKVYFDGVPSGTKEFDTSGIMTSTGPLRISEGFSGLIDEVSIYNRALSASEAADLYNQGKGKLVQSGNGLIAGYSFSEESGTTVNDLSGNNNNGSLVNNPTWSSSDCTLPNQKGLYCYLGTWKSSYGNGFVQPACGEECETGKAFEGSTCDTKFGQADWHNEAGVENKCGSDGQYIGDQEILDYSQDVKTLNCGGYCGDQTVQREYKEECDLGGVGQVPGPENNGDGGTGIDSQYFCSSECVTSGGFCGDGVVQADAGEKCDTKSYIPPTTDYSTIDLQYGCGTVDKKLCQFTGGYCGDGNTQSSFGEECDRNDPNTCVKCKKTSCGDGVVQNGNGNGVYEICERNELKRPCTSGADCINGYKRDINCVGDPECEVVVDQYCSSNCINTKVGGLCDDTKPCDSDLYCVSKKFGDSQGKCLGGRGFKGCRTDDDCVWGYVCDIYSITCSTTKTTLLPGLSKETYTKYRTLPAEQKLTYNSTPTTGFEFDVHPKTCPDVSSFVFNQKKYFKDNCTGLEWSAIDDMGKNPGWSGKEALDGACSLEKELLPNIKQLFTLFKAQQTSTINLPFTESQMNMCAQECYYNLKEDKYCSVCGDSDYLYWSSTCAKENNGVCEKLYAINFKYGSISVYDTADPANKFKVRCMKEPEIDYSIAKLSGEEMLSLFGYCPELFGVVYERIDLPTPHCEIKIGDDGLPEAAEGYYVAVNADGTPVMINGLPLAVPDGYVYGGVDPLGNPIFNLEEITLQCTGRPLNNSFYALKSVSDTPRGRTVDPEPEILDGLGVVVNHDTGLFTSIAELDVTAAEDIPAYTIPTNYLPTADATKVCDWDCNAGYTETQDSCCDNSKPGLAASNKYDKTINSCNPNCASGFTEVNMSLDPGYTARCCPSNTTPVAAAYWNPVSTNLCQRTCNTGYTPTGNFCCLGNPPTNGYFDTSTAPTCTPKCNIPAGELEVDYRIVGNVCVKRDCQDTTDPKDYSAWTNVDCKSDSIWEQTRSKLAGSNCLDVLPHTQKSGSCSYCPTPGATINGPDIPCSATNGTCRLYQIFTCQPNHTLLATGNSGFIVTCNSGFHPQSAGSQTCVANTCASSSGYAAAQKCSNYSTNVVPDNKGVALTNDCNESCRYICQWGTLKETSTTCISCDADVKQCTDAGGAGSWGVCVLARPKCWDFYCSQPLVAIIMAGYGMNCNAMTMPDY